MNFAPTNIVQAFEDEVFEEGGRNEFRPYNVGGSLRCRGYADGKKSVSLADTIFVFAIYPAHLAVYGVTSKSASSRTPRPWWMRYGCRGVIHRARAERERRNWQYIRCLRVTGEMNFAPTMWVESLDDEAVDGGGCYFWFMICS
jgi:hypothetical protein